MQSVAPHSLRLLQKISSFGFDNHPSVTYLHDAFLTGIEPHLRGLEHLEKDSADLNPLGKVALSNILMWY